MSTAIKRSHFDHVFNNMILYKSGCDCDMEGGKKEYIQKIDGYKSLAFENASQMICRQEFEGKFFILRKISIVNMGKKNPKWHHHKLSCPIVTFCWWRNCPRWDMIALYWRNNLPTTYILRCWRFSPFRSNLKTNHPHMTFRCFFLIVWMRTSHRGNLWHFFNFSKLNGKKVFFHLPYLTLIHPWFLVFHLLHQVCILT